MVTLLRNQTAATGQKCSRRLVSYIQMNVCTCAFYLKVRFNQLHRQLEGWIDRSIHRQIDRRQLGGWIYIQLDRWIDRYMDRRQVGGWIDKQIDGGIDFCIQRDRQIVATQIGRWWINKYIDGWIDRYIDRQIVDSQLGRYISSYSSLSLLRCLL